MPSAHQAKMGYQLVVAIDSHGEVWQATDCEPTKMNIQAVSITVGRSFAIAYGAGSEVWGWGDNEFN